MNRQLKLPNKIISFSELRENNFIYVDKTAKLQNMIEDGGWYFLARPQGFGKTLTLSTLTAMFSGKAELFEGLAASEFVKQYVEHPYKVINFDFESLMGYNLHEFNKSFEKMLIAIANNFKIDLEYPVSTSSLTNIFSYLRQQFGSFVVLIDNYDKPIIDCKDNTELLFEIHIILRSFYDIVNNYTSSIKFLMIMGIQQYDTYGVFETISDLDDISKNEYYGDILGYTHDELESNFVDFINHKNSNINPKNLFDGLKPYNNKFCFDGVTNVYQPTAIYQSLKYLNAKNYLSYIKKKNNIFKYSCINPGDRLFLAARNLKIYVDKSELLIYTNERIGASDKYICISRPRRFGKTFALDMIAAYYDRTCDASKVFDGLKITKHQSFSIFANKYIVIKITIKDYLTYVNDIDILIQKLKDDITNDLIIQFGKNRYIDDLSRLMDYIALNTELQFVILIDEWDCLLREVKDKLDWQKKYIDFLCYLFKDKPYLDLVYMTGILPIKKYGTHSALNMFNEYNMLYAGKFTEFVGFTQSEVENLCQQYNRDFIECENWYDGYAIRDFTHIYNPKSVNEYISSGEFLNYWNMTETYKALRIYITIEKYGIRDIIVNLLAGDSVTIDPRKFDNDMTSFESADDILTLLVHLGYLSYNYSTSTVKIPNKEIASEFVNSIDKNGWPIVTQAINNSAKLLEAVLDFDCQTVAKGVEDAHLETSILQYNDENALAYTISLAFYTAREKYTIIREFPAGKGFADLVFLPRVGYSYPIIFIELKWDKSVKTALNQIYERRYPDSLKDRNENILLVGINYDKTTKKHTCSIEIFYI